MAAGAYEALAETRPRIRRDVLFTRTPGGVLFHNADGGFHLTGRTAYRFASLLVPHLSGRHRLAEICEGFQPPQRKMAGELVKALYARDFARDAPAEEPEPAADPATAAVASRFAPQIAYVDHYADGARARFAAFRSTRVAVLGRDEVARWCAVGLLRNGCAALGVEGDFPEVDAEAAELEAAGCPVDVTPLLPAGRTGAPEEDDPGWADLADHDVVVVSGVRAAARTHRLLAEGVPEGRVLLPSWTFGEHAVTGPLHRPGASGCWSCALLRLGANRDAATAAELWSEVASAARPLDAAQDGPLHGPVAAMTGNLLGYEVFRLTTGALPAETAAQVLVQDLRSLDVVAEPVHPHPRCRLCRAPAPSDAAQQVLAEGPAAPHTATAGDAREAEQVVEDLNAVTGALVRPWTGTFRRFLDEELTQTPLKVSRLEGVFGARGPRLIAAFDVHHLAGARVRALHAAAVTFVEHVAPAPEEATGVSLLTKETAAVPAAALRPFGPANRERRYPATRAGAGAGASPREAAGSALLSALAHEALLGAVCGTSPVAPLPEDEADPERVFLHRSAGHLEVGVELLALGADSPGAVPVVLARETTADGDGRWAVAAALTRRAAATAALRDLLGPVQLAAQDPDARVDLGDPVLADLAPGTLRVDPAGRLGPDGTTWPAVLEAVRAAGRDVLLVPTTPAALLAGGVHTARVVLTGGADERR
ncbi:TOMM precursor leader peptide-binding protein [Streptomyces chumphonensis]|uniref:TOMM precursor leader peptide-binding protein n=1 Tax=Streptomyces chumphonensis TaxID=1214925 RepID=UPI003D7399EC